MRIHWSHTFEAIQANNIKNCITKVTVQVFNSLRVIISNNSLCRYTKTEIIDHYVIGVSSARVDERQFEQTVRVLIKSLISSNRKRQNNSRILHGVATKLMEVMSNFGPATVISGFSSSIVRTHFPHLCAP